MRIFNLTSCLAVLFAVAFMATGCTQAHQNEDQEDNVRQQSSGVQQQDQDNDENDDREDDDNRERDND